MHLARRQVEPVGGDVGENIDRVADDQDDRVLLQPGLGDFGQDADEQIGVAVDQVQPRLRPACGAGRP